MFRIWFQNFLRDLLKEAKKINDVSEDKLIEYTDTMVCLLHCHYLFLGKRKLHTLFRQNIRLDGTIKFPYTPKQSCTTKLTYSYRYFYWHFSRYPLVEVKVNTHRLYAHFRYDYFIFLQLQVFDANKDGKLQLSEMAKWVLPNDNVFNRYMCNEQTTKTT